MNRRLFSGEAVGGALLAAYALLFCLFLVAPIGIVVAVSFNPEAAVAVPTEGLSLRWYQRLLEYKPFTTAMGTSIGLAFVATALAVLIAVPAALGLVRSQSRAAHGLVSLLLSPIAIPPLVIGLSMLYYLSALGIGVSLFALVITHTVVSVPYVLRTVLAACRNMGTHFEEAARVLGASGWQAFRHVTFPLIAPGVFAGSLFSILMSLDNLGLSYFFGTAKVTTLPVVMLSYLQNQFDPLIAAVSTVQMVLAIVMLLFVERVYGLSALTTQ